MGRKSNLFKMKDGVRSISGWNVDKYSYKNMLAQDHKIHKFFETQTKQMNLEIAEINIYSNKVKLDIVLHTARPGSIFGKSGANIEMFKTALAKILDCPLNIINIQVNTIYNPEINAAIIAARIAKDIEHRKSCNAIIRTHTQDAVRGGAIGVKIKCSGRINGAEIASVVSPPGFGRVPRQTLIANIYYAQSTARTSSGALGVKVYINKPKTLLANSSGISKKRSSNIQEDNIKSSEGAGS